MLMPSYYASIAAERRVRLLIFLTRSRLRQRPRTDTNQTFKTAQKPENDGLKPADTERVRLYHRAEAAVLMRDLKAEGRLRL